MRWPTREFADKYGIPRSGQRHVTAMDRLVGSLLAALVVVVPLTVVRTVMRDDEPAADTGVCGTVSVDPVSAERAHREGTISYGAAPPSSGDHSPVPLSPSDFYIARPAPADVVERAVHSLERGYVVIFYGKYVSDEDVREVVAAAGRARLAEVVVVPWDRGAFDVRTSRFVLTAWGHRLPCDDPSPDSILTFGELYGGSNGTAPKKDAA